MLKPLHNCADLGLLARRRTWLVQNLTLSGREDTSDAIDEHQCILGRPEVDVEGMQLVVVLGLVMRVPCREMPLLSALDLADRECYQAYVPVRVAQMDFVEV